MLFQRLEVDVSLTLTLLVLAVSLFLFTTNWPHAPAISCLISCLVLVNILYGSVIRKLFNILLCQWFEILVYLSGVIWYQIEEDAVASRYKQLTKLMRTFWQIIDIFDDNILNHYIHTVFIFSVAIGVDIFLDIYDSLAAIRTICKQTSWVGGCNDSAKLTPG